MSKKTIIRTADICDSHPEASLIKINFNDYGKRQYFHGVAVTYTTYEDIRGIREILSKEGGGCTYFPLPLDTNENLPYLSYVFPQKIGQRKKHYYYTNHNFLSTSTSQSQFRKHLVEYYTWGARSNGVKYKAGEQSLPCLINNVRYFAAKCVIRKT